LEWTQRVKQEYDNIRKALEWAFQDSSQANFGLSIITNIADRFLFPMGYHQEGADWLKIGLEVAGDTIPKLLLARVYYYHLYLDQIYEPEKFQENIEHCIRVCREAEPESNRELSLALAWSVDFFSQKEALNRLEQAVQIARGMGESGKWALTWILFLKSAYLCSLQQQAFDNQAYDAALESVQLTQTGDRWHAAGYWTLGIVETRRGQMSRAYRSLQKVLDLATEMEDKGGIFSSLFCLAWYYRMAGQTDLALRYCKDMYTILEWFSSLANGLFYALGMVLILRRSGIASKDNKQARLDGLRLLALYDKIGRYWHPFDHKTKELTVRQMRGKMGETAFQAIWSEGQAMSLDEGMTYAGSLLEKYAPNK
jgi:tetratricopeptide (TPR) repeat protein